MIVTVRLGAFTTEGTEYARSSTEASARDSHQRKKNEGPVQMSVPAPPWNSVLNSVTSVVKASKRLSTHQGMSKLCVASGVVALSMKTLMLNLPW